MVHPGSATIPALASCAAHRQGKFSEMEKLIWEKGFKAGRNLGQENMDKLAGELGLDMGKFKADIEGACKKIVTKDQGELRRVGARGTPAFFINGRYVSGAQSYAVFESLVQEHIADAKKMVANGTAPSAVSP